ncbi:hydroxymethylpyrimidine phosphomethylpyrimidine kinase [Lactobacillus selangorensis]|uniref:pyridoxal kinase n=1 Tax=Lactobacillus selangorensis TaxID=81857 RepID=A0A0R2FKA4_9LACO|nr:bifunctional hydroxymethylpyrimidine kinase/phosphomethylpyrimidine kinase [Lactobacillus selangorensis]KRN29016.1 hydroxymethylpyrimidine phosphomethylpyrimidine kinase [Lactobacillus selangorensis]KRN32574.1 hydroxymethylpyrimidine phosphomethylpyrimidine kinase [Lactobacillus selangorensis]
MTEPLKTLAIAGHDTSAAGGMDADLKTFEEFGTYGMLALTCVVTMDPDHNWAHTVHQVPLDILKAQLKTVFAGQPFAAMKTGMLGDEPTVQVAAEAIERHQMQNVVIDPVMICKGETEVLNPDAADAIRNLLLPLATLTTPNLFEAATLAQTDPIKTVDDMKNAAVKIHELGAQTVIVKGGKGLTGTDAIDVFFDGQHFETLHSQKRATDKNAGAGCTFAAAAVGALAHGKTPQAAVHIAKDFDTEAIHDGFQLNQYLGPVFHPAYRLKTQGGLKF